MSGRTEATIGVGDIVQLKSGGADMTVTAVDSQGVDVVWFNSDVRLERRYGLPRDMLNVIVPDPAGFTSRAIGLGEKLGIGPDLALHYCVIGEAFVRLWERQSAFSQRAFGDDDHRGPIGPLKHLAREAEEAQKNPAALEEFCDCLLLSIDATRRARFSLMDWLNRAHDKLTENERRIWPPVTYDDEPVEHIREKPVDLSKRGDQ